MHRLLVGVTLALLASLTFTATSGAINKPLKLTIVASDGGAVRLDQGTLGASTGDTIVLSYNVSNGSKAQLAQKAHATVGMLRGACTVLTAHVRWLCRWVFQLPNGQVHLSGIVDIAAPKAAEAVIGGTGAYLNARGWADRFPAGRGSQWTLRLVP